MKKLFVLILLASIAGCKNNEKENEENIPPADAPASISFSVNRSFPHDTSSYTQGLIIYKGELYEGTGLEGRSKLMKIDLESGKVKQSISLDPKYFGEGITIVNDTIYQLTWKDRVVFMYNLKDFKKLKEFSIHTDGWGITTDGKELIVSDGTSNLNFYEPGTLRQLRTVSITESGALVNNVNELEFIDGFVYANRYQTDHILKIDPVTGIVVGKADFTNLANEMRAKNPYVDYFNGIAYDSTTKNVYLTGKLWPLMYEVRFGQ